MTYESARLRRFLAPDGASRTHDPTNTGRTQGSRLGTGTMPESLSSPVRTLAEPCYAPPPCLRGWNPKPLGGMSFPRPCGPPSCGSSASPGRSLGVAYSQQFALGSLTASEMLFATAMSVRPTSSRSARACACSGCRATSRITRPPMSAERGSITASGSPWIWMRTRPRRRVRSEPGEQLR